MKKETTKKSKLWLWLVIGLVALVAVAGIVIALVAGGLFADDGPKGGRPDLYWNFDRQTYVENSETGLSMREPGEDGIYRITFAYNGEQVELPIVDKQLVNVIDTMDVMGLEFDADGVVIEVYPVEEVATPVALNVFVQQVTSEAVIANSSIAMNGMRYTIAISDLLEIYNMTNTAEMIGEIIDVSELQTMDSIWVYANDLEEPTHMYVTSHAKQSKVYWRTVQKYDSTKRGTSRPMEEDGAYAVDFCCEGEIVTLRCKDEAIMANIDSKSPHSCHFGFIFDEEGYIIDIINSGVGIRGTVAAERMEVTEVDGNFFSAQQMIPSDNGLTYSATLPEDCPIYDASSVAIRHNRQGSRIDSLQVGDRVCVWTDPMGTPILVYVANRIIDVPVYWSVARQYNSTAAETKREPDAQGYYNFEVVKVGNQGKTTVKTADKALASYMDSLADRILGLELEGNIVKNCYASDDIYGWSSVRSGYTTSVQGSVITVVGFSSVDKPVTRIAAANMKVYDMTGKDVPYGTETTVRVGDYTMMARTVTEEIPAIFIMRREVGGDCVYYNLDRQYDSTTKETKRVPDADGWYVFKLAHKGKVVEVKTKNRELANKIEASPVGDLIVVLRVENGIAYEIYDTQAAYGQVLRSGARVTSVNGDGTFTVVGSTKVESTIKMADDCVIYNVSDNYIDYQGERTYSVKVGDMVSTLADYKSEAKLIYVRRRCVDKMYVNTQRMYNTGQGGTIREPDAEGWYWFHLSEEGTLKWFKTNDAKIAAAVDLYQTPFGIRVEGDVIKNVVGPAYVNPCHKVGDTFWDVVAINGNNVTIKLNKPGYADSGTSKTIYVGSNTKVYDISPTAENFGAPAKLKVGDQIRNYKDFYDNVYYVYITYHPSRVKGEYGYCEHCDKEVQWFPWSGESIPAANAHYYVAADMMQTRQGTVGNDNLDYEVVVDMNGKKYDVYSCRALLVYKGDTLSVIDSVGGGVMSATGVHNGGGGTIRVSGEGTFNLYGGTLGYINDDRFNVTTGATITVNNDCTFNMYGGTLKGGIVDTEKKNVQGGNIYMYASTVNMYDGVIEEGQAIRGEGMAAQGANVFGGGGAVFNMYGGTIRNGYTNQNGANVFMTKSTFNMYDGTITGGVATSNGGNIYSQFESVVTIAGGTIENGTADGLGHNFYAAQDVNELYISGGNIAGDIYLRAGKIVSVSGSPKITTGKVGGLILPTSLKMTVGELKQGAEVAVTATGAFSIANPKAQEYVDKGYVKSAAARTSVVVIDDVMYVEGEEAYCEHCGQIVKWLPWPGTSKPASGHYFLDKDFKQASQLTIATDTDVVLDLGGKIYSSQNIRNFLVYGTLSIMDSVGGGEMVVTGSSSTAGSVAMVSYESVDATHGCFNLYSGTLRLADNHAQFNNGGVIQFGGGVMNVYGGQIIGGDVAQYGGCINVYRATSTLNIYGGLITGGTAALGGDAINVLGTINVEGGTIEGEIYVQSSGVTLSGSPVITELNLVPGIKADVSGLTGTASIGIEASGVFTTALTRPVDYLQFFECVDSSKAIRVAGDALEVSVGQGQIDAYNAIHTEAEKMTADGVFDAGGTVTAECPVCKTEVEWTALETITANTSIDAGHYYLSGSVSNGGHYSINGDSCVHFNGNDVTSAARAFVVNDGFTANFMGEGNITGIGTYNNTLQTYLGVIDVVGTANLYGGTYTSTNAGGAVVVRGYTGTNAVNMYEGVTITRDTTNPGIAVRLYDNGDLNVYGGTITGGTTNVLLQSRGAAGREATLNVYGGTLTTSGVNVDAAGSTTAVNVFGGEILDGAVMLDSEVNGLLISGAPVISELNLTSGMKATLANLTSGADISVRANGAFTEPNEAAADYLQAEYIKSAMASATIYEENGVLIMERETKYCAHCDNYVVWEQWDGHNNPVSGHYFLAENFTAQAEQITILAGTDVILDLQGHAYTTADINTFLVNGTLSIIDSVSGGTVTASGSVADVAAGAILNIYDGAYTGNITVNGALNMSGGSINGDVVVTADALGVKLSNGVSISKLEIARGKLIDVSGLTSGAQIGVSAEGIFTKPLTNAESYLTYFVKLLTEDEYSVVNDAISLDTITELDRLNAIHETAEKMTADGVFAAGGTVTADCPVCGTEVQWTELNTLGAAAINADGHYYLSDSLTEATGYSIGANVCLHLNGNDITATDKAAITVNAKDGTTPYVLNIMGEGVVSGKGITNSVINRGGAIDVLGTVNLYGGTYKSVNNMPVIDGRGYNLYSDMSIYDGAEIISEATYTEPAVMMRATDVFVYGGTITGGNGHAIKTTGGYANTLIAGGTITNGSTDTHTVYVGVPHTGAKSVAVNISGGTITGGGVFIDTAVKTVSVSGNPVISRLDLTNGKTLTVGDMVVGAEIFVEAEGAITGTLANAEDYLSFLKPFTEGYEVAVVNNTLVVRVNAAAKQNKVYLAAEKMTADDIFAAGGAITAECPVCEEEVEWTELNTIGSMTGIPAGHYYLSESVENTTWYSFGGDACLHLNGCNITSSSKALQTNAPDGNTAYVLNVMGEGTVTGAGIANSTINRGGALDIAGKANLFGGTYKCSNDMPVVSGRGYANNCYLNIYDGAEILGDEAHDVPSIVVRSCDVGVYGGLISGGKGGNIYASGGVSVVGVYGGIIENGGAAVGGNIYAATSKTAVDIAGGIIRNGSVYVASDAKYVKVSGKPTVSELDLTSGMLLTLGLLEDGADITVKANDGVFTTASADAANYVGYFKVPTGKCVKEENYALVIANA